MIRVDALTELGHYRAQLTALRQADRRQPGVPVFARYSYAEELRGRIPRAESLLRRALHSSTVRTDQAYLLTLLADLQRRSGHLDAAGALISQALTAVPDYVPALASRARLMVARHELPKAVRAWKDVTSRLALPEYLLELGELYEATGHPSRAHQQFHVLQATKMLLAANGVRVDLETALYEADHGSPAAALDAARDEWSRRHSVQVADALAWALHVNGRDEAAIRLSRFATRMNTPAAMLWVHRGRIEAALGRDAAATTDIRRGLALDPGALSLAGRPGPDRSHIAGGIPMNRLTRAMLRAGTVVVAAVAVVTGVGAAAAIAHPLGNFTVNRYTGSLVSPDHVLLDHVLDFAEIPTAQFGDQIKSLPELAARECDSERHNLAVTVAGDRVALRSLSARGSLGTGQANLPLLRVECLLRGDFPALRGSTDVTVVDTSAGRQIGWREMTARADKTTMVHSDVSTDTISARLSSYPRDLLSSPLDQRSAALVVRPGGPPGTLETSTGGPPATDEASGVNRFTEWIAGLLDEPGTGIAALTLLAALALVTRGGARPRQDRDGLLSGRPAPQIRTHRVLGGPDRDAGAHRISAGSRPADHRRLDALLVRPDLPVAHRGERRAHPRTGSGAAACRAARKISA